MSLNVYHISDLVGTIDSDSTGHITFAYKQTWLENPKSFPISVSMKLRAEPYAGPEAHNFFANLLPEGTPREQLTKRYGISLDNDFALLEKIGGECAGALVLAAKAPDPQDSEYEGLQLSSLIKSAQTGSILAQTTGTRGIRLSLAGAQDKLPVYIDSTDQKIYTPLHESPSTHILKFPSKHFKHMPENEALMAALAIRLNLLTAETRLLQVPEHDAPCLLVTRYDRLESAHSEIRRLHQEDFCQALGISPRLKYEQEGGPSFRDCVKVIEESSTAPAVDKERLIEWIIFNVAIGNADAHAKNISLLYGPGREIRLAPFYDMLCTHVYPTISKHCAMSVGMNSDPGSIKRQDWEQTAETIGVRKSFFLDKVSSIASGCKESIETVAAEFIRNQNARKEHVDRIVQFVKKQSKRTLTLLGDPKKQSS